MANAPGIGKEKPFERNGCMQLSRSSLHLSDVGALEARPERILQIGEGRFMRGFVDWFIHRLNQDGAFAGGVVVVSPRASGAVHIRAFAEQDGLFSVWLRGRSHGQVVDQREVVTAVSRVIDPYADWSSFMRCAELRDLNIVVSNTTEAGLIYQPERYQAGCYLTSYPAKLTAYLYHRYQYFAGDREAGLTIVPCELVEDNGSLLQEIVLHHGTDWGLSDDFMQWVRSANHFCNALVDRIVTGYPHELGREVNSDACDYEDRLLTVAEPYFLWAIEADERLRREWSLPSATGLLYLVDDVGPFRRRKVRILNGAHTTLFAPAFLAGIQTVRAVVEDPVYGTFVRRAIDEEVLPLLCVKGDREQEQALMSFAAEVWERFRNPFIRHEIASLGHNGIAKIRARVVPSILDYAGRYGRSPRFLAISMAAHLLYYRNTHHEWVIQDQVDWLAAMERVWNSGADIMNIVSELLALQDVWGSALTSVPGLVQAVTTAITEIDRGSITDYLRRELAKWPEEI